MDVRRGEGCKERKEKERRDCRSTSEKVSVERGLPQEGCNNDDTTRECTRTRPDLVPDRVSVRCCLQRA